MPSKRLQLAVLDRCLLILDELHSGHSGSGDEATLKLLVRRLADVTLAALSLVLEGYYQSSLALQRDVLETGFLLEVFNRFPARIQDWRTLKGRAHWDVFRPQAVRDALQDDEADRTSIYHNFCVYASHVTRPGSHLLVQGQGATAGPRFDQKYLSDCVEEHARHLPYFTVVACRALRDTLPSLQEEIDSYLGFMLEWVNAAFRLGYSSFSTADLGKWARAVWPKHPQRT